MDRQREMARAREKRYRERHPESNSRWARQNPARKREIDAASARRSRGLKRAVLGTCPRCWRTVAMHTWGYYRHKNDRGEWCR